MRLFIALPIPPPVTQQLVDLQQPIEGVRWQNDRQIHLTLKFLGDTDIALVNDLKAHLQKVTVPAFSISLNGFGCFPQGKHPRVLWARVNKTESLSKLQQEVDECCSQLGFETENRPFKPHITIARIDGTPKRDVMSFINQHKQFKIADVPVKEFVLYESKLHPDGAKHSRLKTFSLGS